MHPSLMLGGKLAVEHLRALRSAQSQTHMQTHASMQRPQLHFRRLTDQVRAAAPASPHCGSHGPCSVGPAGASRGERQRF